MKRPTPSVFMLLILILFSNLFGAQIITNLAGSAPAGFAGDGGPASAAKLQNAIAIATDNSGNVYFSDYGNNRVRKISASGAISTIGGNGSTGYGGDGGQATAAQFNGPMGIAVDPAGTKVYIADNMNNRIRMITTATGIITTFAGTGIQGGTGDGGNADTAQIRTPEGLALDAGGNLYIVDNYSQIRKVSATTHIITTIAGGGVNPPVDGAVATSVYLYLEYLTVDPNGNIYFSSPGYHWVRKIAAGTGLLSTIAGNGTGGYAGDNGPGAAAEVYYPYGVAADAAGNVYIADQNNNRVRKVSVTTGYITTYAGNGMWDDSGDGGLATAAALSHPHGIALDASGNMYVSDSSFAIRKITTITGIQELKSESAFQLYPNPGNGDFYLQATGSGFTSIAVYDLTGRVVWSEILNPLEQTINLSIHLDLPDGMYLVQLLRGKERCDRKLVIRK
jgi:DNA-binding beta-propeller fold protein YncE